MNPDWQEINANFIKKSEKPLMSFDQESSMSRIKPKIDESSSNIRTEQSRKRSESIKNEELRRTENSAKKLKKKPTRRGDQKNSFRQ